MGDRKKVTAGIVIAVVILVTIIAVMTSGNNSDPVTTGDNQEDNTGTVTTTSGNEEWSEAFQSNCLTCHATSENGKVERISDIRKTPEGWEQTIFRMKNQWGLDLSREDFIAIVEELSMKNGLAPEETDKVMYWLTDNGSTTEAQMDSEVMQRSCIQCHAGARPLAQYRTPEEWTKVKDFHIGMNPSMIYQMRAVDWVGDADKVAEYLGEINPKETEAWTNWKESGVEYDVEGEWRVVGYRPGFGMYSGDAIFEKQDGQYHETKTLVMPDGTSKEYEGNTRMFSGYSLRSSLASGDQKIRGVFNVKDEEKIEGRWNQIHDLGIYADETYYKKGETSLLAAWPQSLKRGAVETVRVIGMNLPESLTIEDFSTSENLQITEVVKQEKDDVWVKVKVLDEATIGENSISLAESAQDLQLHVYDQVDFIKVIPEFGLARLEYADRKQSTQFEAIGFDAGEDGEPNTEDDVKIGPVNASWSLTEYEFMGFPDEDLKYVGTISSEAGVFTPAEGGLNQNREWSTNNAGNVTVVAEYSDPVSGEVVKGETLLLVTIPDYVYVK